MCGICGKLNLDYITPVKREQLQKMCQSIQHRGPDGEGLWLRGAMGLGHRRLSIIDLATGSQPMCNEDGTIWITFNGEIYNYKELRSELEILGHQFTTNSDTEAIVHGYESWGAEVCTHLHGMFAYAIWDEKQQRLVLTRDRLGKKPIIYAQMKDTFLFASEIRAILQDPSVSRQVDLDAIYAYLMRLYIPSPNTAFENVHKLPPAHYLILEKGQIHLQCYWQVDFRPDQSRINQSEESLCDELWKLLCQSTEKRLMSEVPIGAFLSGGVDSSAIVGMMSQLMREPVKTFSIRYEEAGFDETPYARQISRQFGTEHYEFTVKPNALEVLPTLVWHYSEPFADASAIPTYYVSKLTRQYVTVALSGDAGDENFAGYDYYRAAQVLETIKQFPDGLRKSILPNMLNSAKHIPGSSDFSQRVQTILRRADLPAPEAYLYRTSVFTPEMMSSLWQTEILEKVQRNNVVTHVQNTLTGYAGSSPLALWQFLDLMNYLPDDILAKVDIASMANSLEVRAPLLDHLIVEFAASLPAQMKLRTTHGYRLTTKYILKKTLERILPKEILYRKKHGFAVPLGEWFRNELKPLTHEVLLSKQAEQRGYFNSLTIKRIIEEHESGKIDHGARLWALLNLEMWQRTYMDELRQSPIVI